MPKRKTISVEQLVEWTNGMLRWFYEGATFRTGGFEIDWQAYGLGVSKPYVNENQISLAFWLGIDACQDWVDERNAEWNTEEEE
jgi:hypothetical protein